MRNNNKKKKKHENATEFYACVFVNSLSFIILIVINKDGWRFVTKMRIESINFFQKSFIHSFICCLELILRQKKKQNFFFLLPSRFPLLPLPLGTNIWIKCGGMAYDAVSPTCIDSSELSHRLGNCDRRFMRKWLSMSATFDSLVSNRFSKTGVFVNGYRAEKGKIFFFFF